jgi:hypothetical protein
LYRKSSNIVVLETHPFEKEQNYTITIRGLEDEKNVPLPEVSDNFIYSAASNTFIIDDDDETFKIFGEWESDTQQADYYGDRYLRTDAGDGSDRAQWWTFIQQEGYYEVAVWLPRSAENWADAARYTLLDFYGVDTVYLDQRQGNGTWASLGIYRYSEGAASSVMVSDYESGGTVIADALRIKRVIETYAEEQQDVPVPVRCELFQNFPNPFNPTTTITFRTDARGHVRLEVHNILGQHVATLADERMNAGEHRFIFQAGDLPSGLYFYTINFFPDHKPNINYIKTKKMLLLH